MIHWLLHVLGIDTQTSYWYCFWSGFGTQISFVAAWWWHRNCHRDGCWRIGKHTVNGTPFCTKHHQEVTR